MLCKQHKFVRTAISMRAGSSSVGPFLDFSVHLWALSLIFQFRKLCVHQQARLTSVEEKKSQDARIVAGLQCFVLPFGNSGNERVSARVFFSFGRARVLQIHFWVIEISKWYRAATETQRTNKNAELLTLAAVG